MALLKSGQPGRAMDYVGLAEQQEGSVSATGCIIRMQAALQKQSQASAIGGKSASAAAGGQGGGAGQEEAAAAQGVVLTAVTDLAAARDFGSEAFQVSYAAHYPGLSFVTECGCVASAARQGALHTARMHDPADHVGEWQRLANLHMLWTDGMSYGAVSALHRPPSACACSTATHQLPGRCSWRGGTLPSA